MKLIDCVCRRSSDECNEDGTVSYYDCNANVEYARTFMDEFVLNMQKESNNFYECLSYNNSIYGYNVSLPCKSTITDYFPLSCHNKILPIERIISL